MLPCLRLRGGQPRAGVELGVDSDESYSDGPRDNVIYHTVDADADRDGPGSNQGRTQPHLTLEVSPI